MGANHYTAAVDVWSVGCIFGELLGRRILFQAQSPVQQVRHMYISPSFVMYCNCIETNLPSSPIVRHNSHFNSLSPIILVLHQYHPGQAQSLRVWYSSTWEPGKYLVTDRIRIDWEVLLWQVAVERKELLWRLITSTRENNTAAYLED